jgi:hypothetical protein
MVQIEGRKRVSCRAAAHPRRWFFKTACKGNKMFSINPTISHFLAKESVEIVIYSTKMFLFQR